MDISNLAKKRVLFNGLVYRSYFDLEINVDTMHIFSL